MSFANSPGPGARTQRGFTLLEAMCAFAILALLTGQLTRQFSETMRRAQVAVSQRDLREAADTIFRKMIYEWHRYNDGDSKTLDQEFAQLYGGKTTAGPRGYALDRFQVYTYVLEIKDKTVVGAADPNGRADALFDPTETDSSGSSSGSGSNSSGTTEEEGGRAGLVLKHMVLRIYDTENRGDPLLVLSTWIDPRDEQAGAQQPR